MTVDKRAGERCRKLIVELLGETTEDGHPRFNPLSLAKRVGVTRSTITNIRDREPGKEAGKRAISAFMRTFKINHEYFYGDVEPTTYRAFVGRAPASSSEATVPLSFVEFLEMYNPKGYDARVRTLMLGRFREGDPADAAGWAKVYELALRAVEAGDGGPDPADAAAAVAAGLAPIEPTTPRRR